MDFGLTDRQRPGSPRCGRSSTRSSARPSARRCVAGRRVERRRHQGVPPPAARPGLAVPHVARGARRPRPALVDNLLLMDELAYAGAPAIDMTAASVAPTIIRSGTPRAAGPVAAGDQAGRGRVRRRLLRARRRKRPASLRTTAALDGDAWVINGTKIWNTGAEYCTHEWLACRTDPDAPRYRGISVLIVPLDTPGIEVRASPPGGGCAPTRCGSTTCAPCENLVGQRDHGWAYVTQALDFERVAIGITGGLRRLLTTSPRGAATPRSTAGRRRPASKCSAAWRSWPSTSSWRAC